jgi:hypothetical protein
VPVLVLNPRSDGAFVELVERLAKGCGDRSGKATAGHSLDAARLVEGLRWWYPRVRIRRRNLGPGQPDAWYIYRDGVPVPDEPPIRADTMMTIQPPLARPPLAGPRDIRRRPGA